MPDERKIPPQQKKTQDNSPPRDKIKTTREEDRRKTKHTTTSKSRPRTKRPNESSTKHENSTSRSNRNKRSTIIPVLPNVKRTSKTSNETTPKDRPKVRKGRQHTRTTRHPRNKKASTTTNRHRLQHKKHIRRLRLHTKRTTNQPSKDRPRRTRLRHPTTPPIHPRRHPYSNLRLHSEGTKTRIKSKVPPPRTTRNKNSTKEDKGRLKRDKIQPYRRTSRRASRKKASKPKRMRNRTNVFQNRYKQMHRPPPIIYRRKARDA